MMQLANPADLEQAFAVLTDCVADLNAHGRRALGATLKPDIVRRTYGGFDEKALGFSTFGHFVRSARDRGLVDIFPAPGSQDMEVVPKGTTPRPPDPAEQRRATPADSNLSGFIREDFWKAFVDWSVDIVRLYNVEEDRIVMFPKDPAPLEPIAYAEARDAWHATPERYREIEPLLIDTQIGWMKDFAALEPDGPRKTIMEFALSRDRPFREFSHAVREYPDLGRSWQAFRKARVVDTINEWMTENDIEVSLSTATSVVKPEASQRAQHAPSRDPASVGKGDLDHLRKRVHEAVDRMSAADLLRLSIPVEYLVDY